MNLNNVSFLIPYYFNCPERRENYRQVTEFLLGLDARILTSEMPYFDNGIYLRTKTFNNLARIAKTDIIVLYDADVFCDPGQLRKAADMVRGVSIVRAYDGSFHDVKDMEKHEGPMLHTDSVGGIVFVDRKIFWEVGGENEMMLGWGFEDNERKSRWEKLGYKMASVAGPLYHLTHPRSKETGLQVDKNRAEFEKVRKMTPARLRQYISTWDWVKER